MRPCGAAIAKSPTLFTSASSQLTFSLGHVISLTSRCAEPAAPPQRSKLKSPNDKEMVSANRRQVVQDMCAEAFREQNIAAEFPFFSGMSHVPFNMAQSSPWQGTGTKSYILKISGSFHLISWRRRLSGCRNSLSVSQRQ